MNQELLKLSAYSATCKKYGLVKFAEDGEETPWYKKPMVLGAGAAALSAPLLYAALRRKSGRPEQAAMHEAAKGRFTHVMTGSRPESKIQQLWDRIRYAGGGEVRYGSDPAGKIHGAARYSLPKQVDAHPADYAGGATHMTANMEDLQADKLFEHQFVERHVPGAMAPSEGIHSVLGHNKSTPKSEEAAVLSALQKELREAYPEGFVIKDVQGRQSGGNFPSEKHDFNELLKGYREKGLKEKAYYGVTGQDLDKDNALYRELAQDPHYAGRVLEGLLSAPRSAMVQARLPLAKLEGGHARLNRALGGGNPTKEVRVHIENGVAVPELATSRFDILGSVLDDKGHRAAVEFAQQAVNKFPEAERRGTYGMDIAPLEGGGHKIIETNPGGMSGLIQGTDPRVAANLHKYYTGQYSPMVAGAGATLGAGAVGTGVMGASALGRNISRNLSAEDDDGQTTGAARAPAHARRLR